MATNTTTKQCTRPGCGRNMRRDNAKGVCSTNCLSPEAPAGERDPNADGDVLKRFRRVAKALGKDPEMILDEAMRKVAQQWLDTVEAAVK